MWNARKSADEKPGSPGGAKFTQMGELGRTIWMFVERLLLIAGLALLAGYGVAKLESALSSRAAVKQFTASKSPAVGPASQNVAEENAETVTFLPADTAEADFSLWGKKRLAAYQKSLAQHSDVPLAVLHISKIHLEVPVFNGTDRLTLNRGVGRISGTARPGEPGNIGIAGHRDGFFRGLKDISAGDAILLETAEGTDTYIVEKITIVSPQDVGVLQPRAVPSLTLVTCYPFYYVGSAPQRYIVTASLTRETKSGSAEVPPDPLSQTSSSSTRRNNEQSK